MSALSLSWGPQLPYGDFSPQGNPKSLGLGAGTQQHQGTV